MWRRPLSRFLPAVPVLLLIWAALSEWTRISPPRAAALGLILASSAVIFAQALLSDREGRMELSFACAPTSGRLAPVRWLCLFAGPFAAQLLLLRILLAAFRL
jgi:hypothetical protein